MYMYLHNNFNVLYLGASVGVPWGRKGLERYWPQEAVCGKERRSVLCSSVADP